MIGGHSNELFSQEILMSLWKKFKESVKLNHIVITTPDGLPFNSNNNHKQMNLLQRTLSVMGAHVQVPVPQMGTRHRDVSITLTPQMNFDDADLEASEIDTPLLRP
uniref:Uncharacterized protein n=1 Tax=Panagrolaimus superbus TaxID=310955 RepID=A0A914Y543_9BILA